LKVKFPSHRSFWSSVSLMSWLKNDSS
jgi:hypothetical protein